MFKTVLAYENWKSKYAYNNEEPLDTFKRVAKALASVEKYPELWYEMFLKTLVKFDPLTNEPIGLKCTPGGRITANAGTEYDGATLINCFINGPVTNAKITYDRKSKNTDIGYEVEINTEETPDNLHNIFLTILEQAKTLASEGGYGINFSFIRPRGTLIKSIGIKHPGVVSYMEIWDAVSECIVKGDADGYRDKIKNYLGDEKDIKDFENATKKMVRKGAMMGVIDVSHPDVEEFIKAKQESGKLTKFNISVAVDDLFMQAVDNNDFYDLHFNGVIYKRVKARDLYNLMMESTYNRAEPGILFVDNMHRNNPVSYLGKATCANPCIREGSLVTTNNGIFPVESIKENDIIQTTIGFGATKEIEIHENYPVYRVYFGDGSYQDVTMGHVFHAQKKENDNRKKWFTDYTLADLKVGDFVRKERYKYKLPNDGNKLFNRKKGLLAGLYLGDGYIDVHGNVVICVNRDEDNTFIHNLAKELDCASWEDTSSEDKSLKILIGGKDEKRASLILKELGLDTELYCENKTFPYQWLNTNNDFIAGLIDGLISSNGNVNLTARYPQIRFKNTSHDLHLMVRHLMLYIGADYKFYESGKIGDLSIIDGRAIERKYICYEGIIENDSITNFYNFIGNLSHVEKNNDMHYIIKNYSLNGVKWKTSIKKVEYIGEYTVYDLYEPNSDDWNSCGIVSRGCGEVPGIADLTTVCLLGSLNLTQYIDDNRTFDFDQYTADIRIFTRMLDNVNDLATTPLPSYTWAVKNLRQIGMGINGFGSALLMLGIPYNSQEALDFAKRVCQIKENITWQTSAMLAHEKGTFLAYDKEKFESTEYFLSDRITEETKEMLRKYGARNAKTTTNPPLGNTSVICDNVSNGIEPVFSLEYERTRITESWPEGLNKDNITSILKMYKKQDYTYWRGEYNGKVYYYEPHNRGLCEVKVIRDYGYEWVLENFPKEDHSSYTQTTQKLKAEDHLAVQEIVQFYCNQSVSKTINLPKSYSFTNFKSLYMEAWKKGLNGLTTYREGSMEAVISNIEKAEKTREILKDDIKLPNTFLNGPTTIVKREGMKFYIHFSYLPEDTEMRFPVCLWIYTNSKPTGQMKYINKAVENLTDLVLKCGLNKKLVDVAVEKTKNDQAHNKLGRMISLCLRHNIPRDKVYTALSGIEGDNISTMLTAVRHYISNTIEDGTVLSGIKCDSCKGENVRMVSGCKQCADCGYSACG